MIKIINNKPDPLLHFKDMNTICCNVEDIIKDQLNILSSEPIYFVSPANSLLFMDIFVFTVF